MIPAFSYQYIYIILIAFLTFISLEKYRTYSSARLNSNARQTVVPVILLTSLLTIFIGFRPVDVKYFVDMYNYDMNWYEWADPNYKFIWDTDNKIFDNLFGYLSGAGVSSRFFFLLIAFIYFSGIAWVCVSIFPQDKFIAFLVYLAAFSTFAYSVNGLKAGSAASLFLIGLAFYLNKKYVWTILFLLISLGFHHSMILPIVCFLICLLYSNPRVYTIFWLICLSLAAFKVTYFQTLFATFIDEQGASYLLGGGHIKTSILGGFRIDFILYSVIPIIIGLVAIVKRGIKSKAYNFLLSLYILINSIWLLCMYAEFTNRISYLSWFLYPIVLIYPFLRESWGNRQYGAFRIVALAHLFFTIFMVVFYYA